MVLQHLRSRNFMKPLRTIGVLPQATKILLSSTAVVFALSYIPQSTTTYGRFSSLSTISTTEAAPCSRDPGNAAFATRA